MGQLILCKSPRAETPFHINSARADVYSLEELMYFLQKARYVARDDFMRPEFADWIERDLRLPELSGMLREKMSGSCSLRDFFLPVEAANGYLTTNELQLLNIRFQKYDHMSGLEAKKYYADEFMRQEKYARAVLEYRRLLSDPAVIGEQGHVAGDIWSNLGCAYARLHDFAEAAECFARGYMLNRRIETLQQAVDAACLSGDPGQIDKLSARFAANAQQIASERAHIEQLLAQTLKAQESLRVSEQMLAKWMESYREQCKDA